MPTIENLTKRLKGYHDPQSAAHPDVLLVPLGGKGPALLYAPPDSILFDSVAEAETYLESRNGDH